jgi:hypothetical protein
MPLSAGDRLGRYEIIEALGAGGRARSTAPTTRGWIGTTVSDRPVC